MKGYPRKITVTIYFIIHTILWLLQNYQELYYSGTFSGLEMFSMTVGTLLVILSTLGLLSDFPKGARVLSEVSAQYKHRGAYRNEL